MAALFHIVFRTYADGLKCGLRPNHMLKGMPELFSELAMGDKHQSDHIASSSTRRARTHAGSTPIVSHLRITRKIILDRRARSSSQKSPDKPVFTLRKEASFGDKKRLTPQSTYKDARAGRMRHRTTDL
jgi:hypothetical protein